jgi:predicted TIM-barrel fold metal-dependent hydrolase
MSDPVLADRHQQTIIDVHAHYSAGHSAALATGVAGTQSWSGAPMSDSEEHLALRLNLMNDAAVRLQIVSSPPTPYYINEADAVRFTRLSNESLSQLAQGFPGRFAAFASLPLPHLQASLREMDWAMAQPGMVGVMLLCSCNGKSIAHADFDPLYAQMDRFAGTLFLHPCVNGVCSPLVTEFGLSASVGTSLEDALVVIHMIVNRVPHRYPRIKMIVPHFGGPLPMLLQRLDNQLVVAHPGLPEPPSFTARRFWYDTVGHGSRAALLCAREAFGAERLLAGSDYPFLLPHENYRQTFSHVRAAGLADGDIDHILHRNAAGLFGLH